MNWISVNRQLPEDRQLVYCYRDSPNDAEPMIFTGDCFIDRLETVWKIGVITHWRPDTPVV